MSRCRDIDQGNVIQDAAKSRKGGRNSGGIVLLYKNAFQDWISIVKKSPNFLWFKISKQYAKTTEDIYTCGLYIPPCNLQYFNEELFDELEETSNSFPPKDQYSNSRTGKYSDSICHDGNNIITNDQSEFSLRPTQTK